MGTLHPHTSSPDAAGTKSSVTSRGRREGKKAEPPSPPCVCDCRATVFSSLSAGSCFCFSRDCRLQRAAHTAELSTRCYHVSQFSLWEEGDSTWLKAHHLKRAGRKGWKWHPCLWFWLPRKRVPRYKASFLKKKKWWSPSGIVSESPSARFQRDLKVN